MTAEVLDIPADEYHADTTSISRSQGEVLRDDPALFFGMMNGPYQHESNDDLTFGNAIDEAIFGGRQIMEIPTEVLAKNGARSGNAWKEFREAHADKLLVKADEPLKAVLHALRSSPLAMGILESEGHSQYTLRWPDLEFEVKRRARLDHFRTVKVPLIADLKTSFTVDPKRFAKHAYELGYHRQVAWYQDAIHALAGMRPPFVFICCKKSPPYSVEVIELDREFIELGRRQNQATLRRYLRCLESGQWVSPTHGKIITVGAPTWAYADEQWELDDAS